MTARARNAQKLVFEAGEAIVAQKDKSREFYQKCAERGLKGAAALPPDEQTTGNRKIP